MNIFDPHTIIGISLGKLDVLQLSGPPHNVFVHFRGNYYNRSAMDSRGGRGGRGVGRNERGSNIRGGGRSSSYLDDATQPTPRSTATSDLIGRDRYSNPVSLRGP